MAKTNAEKQREYTEQVKVKQNSDYLKKDRERKPAQRELLKKPLAKYQEYTQKECEKKAVKKTAEQSLITQFHS